MDFEDLKIHPETGKNFIVAAKEMVQNCVKVKETKPYKTTFIYRGFYGCIEYSDMVSFISVRISKKLSHSITDEDYELAETVNKSSGKYHGLLEINPDRNTCSARTVLFFQSGLNEEIFLGALNDCCDNLESFFKT